LVFFIQLQKEFPYGRRTTQETPDDGCGRTRSRQFQYRDSRTPRSRPAVRQTQWASRRLTITQEKRAKDLLTEDLSSEPSLGRIAEALGLPPSTLRAAFRASTGQPPFRWLRQHRVETAKYLLQGKSLRLSEIAYACGFADQSHFTRVFTSHTGLTPGDSRALC
jgi:AraC-like DNA-binding protein